MKTLKNYFLLSIALVISATNIVFASNPEGKSSKVPVNPAIRYQVRIDLPSEQALCNVYQVEILDGRGYQVAPAKIFIPGVSLYDFYERGPVNGVRIARLVVAPIGKENRQYNCDRELFATPVAMQGPFENGRTYKFELLLQSTPIK